MLQVGIAPIQGNNASATQNNGSSTTETDSDSTKKLESLQKEIAAKRDDQ